jgi:hypothetical protein
MESTMFVRKQMWEYGRFQPLQPPPPDQVIPGMLGRVGARADWRLAENFTNIPCSTVHLKSVTSDSELPSSKTGKLDESQSTKHLFSRKTDPKIPTKFQEMY